MKSPLSLRGSCPPGGRAEGEIGEPYCSSWLLRNSPIVSLRSTFPPAGERIRAVNNHPAIRGKQPTYQIKVPDYSGDLCTIVSPVVERIRAVINHLVFRSPSTLS